MMASVVVRNLSDATHRAIKTRALAAGRSTEAEIRLILDSAVQSQTRPRLGSMLMQIGQEVGGVDWDNLRDKSTDNAVSF